MSYEMAADEQVIKLFRADLDLSVASYILRYCLEDGPKSIGSIGAISRDDTANMRILARPETNFVLLNTDHSDLARKQLSEIALNGTAPGYAARIAVADLTQDERWPSLLEALALCAVGVIGFDVAWAANYANFWNSLTRYLEAPNRVAFIRDLFNYRNPESCVELLRIMPTTSKLSILATTAGGSLWLCANDDLASRIRGELTQSGLFQSGSKESSSRAVIVNDTDYAAGLIDCAGRLPQTVYHVQGQISPGLELLGGWNEPEPDGCWSEGKFAELLIKLPSQELAGGEFRICGNPWISPVDSYQVIEFTSDRMKERWAISRLTLDEIVSIRVPFAAADVVNGAIALNLKISNPGRPSDYGSEDIRTLGFKLRSIIYYPN